ncbi:class I SAM-dependent DNA methyltransferase [Halalkalibacterium ligniniphilum]|uniref:class I SAM-dependent DNA methyltransferase n=1 Tax=Halalkalibacterium ligniniphilum TaxID=1134413 RepID=UPI00034663CC|nr:class I SAM-dependent methyltransferase [Halalkalibacterium ligniniphilum]
MKYEGFASIYDVLMEDAPYEQWVAFVEENVQVHEISGRSLLDLGCGTGQLLLPLLEAGYDVTGVDISANMLAVAKEKLLQAGYDPLLVQRDMRELSDLGSFDVITAFCDSLNYLQTENDVERTFSQVHEQLKAGGLFMFDVHSVSKVMKGFVGQTFADDGEEISYIWRSFHGEWDASVEHELSFFVKKEEGLYERFDELHVQRTYPIKQYIQWLKQAGFTVLNVTADFSKELPTEHSERIFFVAKKEGDRFPSSE